MFRAGLREPHGSRPRLAVPEVQVAFPVVAPLQCEDFALAAAGQEQKPDDRRLLRPAALMRLEPRRQMADFIVGQEPLPALAAVAPDPPAGVGTLRAHAHRLRLPHDDGQHRHGPVRRHRRRSKRGEPVPHLLPVDVRDLTPGEMRQELAAEIASVHIERSGLPEPRMALEHGLGDGLEKRLVGTMRSFLPPPDCGKRLDGRSPRLGDAHGSGIADDLPDALAARCWHWTKNRFLPVGITRTPKPLSLVSRTS